MKTICLLILTSLSVAFSAQAGSMKTGKIELKFLSKDAQPIEGVSLMGMLQFDKLTVEDCSGFICMPSLPHYTPGSESAEYLGTTNSHGILSVSPRTFETSLLSAKNLGALIYTNGTVNDLCKDGNSGVVDDYMDLLPQWIGTQAQQRNPECQSVRIQSGDNEDLQITCYSPYSFSEIQDMKAKVLAKCH